MFEKWTEGKLVSLTSRLTQCWKSIHSTGIEDLEELYRQTQRRLYSVGKAPTLLGVVKIAGEVKAIERIIWHEKKLAEMHRPA